MKLLLENWRQYLIEQRSDIHIFFDMDGVLVDFAGKVAEEINKTRHEDPDEFYSNSKSKRRALRRLQAAFEEEGRTEDVTAEELEAMTAKKDAGGERTKTEKRISDYLFSLVANNPQLWIDMGVLPGAEEMVSLGQQIGNVYILTSPVDDASKGAKRQWISNHFPELPPDSVIVTGEKGAHLQGTGIIERGERAILIDDRAKYIEQFKGAGGETIHHAAASASKTMNFLRSLAK